MLLGNEFHILGPWNRIEKIFWYLFYRYEVGKRQSISLNIDETDLQMKDLSKSNR